MQPSDQARVDKLAEELIQLAHKAGETIFIAAGLNGSHEVEAVLIVTTDPPKAKHMEQVFEKVAEEWEKLRETHYAAQRPAEEPHGIAERPARGLREGALGLN